MVYGVWTVEICCKHGNEYHNNGLILNLIVYKYEGQNTKYNSVIQFEVDSFDGNFIHTDTMTVKVQILVIQFMK